MLFHVFVGQRLERGHRRRRLPVDGGVDLAVGHKIHVVVCWRAVVCQPRGPQIRIAELDRHLAGREVLLEQERPGGRRRHHVHGRLEGWRGPHQREQVAEPALRAVVADVDGRAGLIRVEVGEDVVEHRDVVHHIFRSMDHREVPVVPLHDVAELLLGRVKEVIPRPVQVRRLRDRVADVVDAATDEPFFVDARRFDPLEVEGTASRPDPELADRPRERRVVVDRRRGRRLRQR
mmetsp:Transcript_4538/g.14477  ORF Transcript_4538/g.14477 Transcript_4538/m.14477 type:complete len:234 (+) Transcript_4538:1142-1843(+)